MCTPKATWTTTGQCRQRGCGANSTAHPLLTAGLADGDLGRLVAAADGYDAEFSECANRAVWARMQGRAEPLPSGPFYPQ
jgi:hypothetical protein